MAYRITKTGNETSDSVVELVADAAADILELPTTYGPGSTVFVIATSSVYMLGNDKVWHQI